METLLPYRHEIKVRETHLFPGDPSGVKVLLSLKNGAEIEWEIVGPNECLLRSCVDYPPELDQLTFNRAAEVIAALIRLPPKAPTR